LQRLLLEDYPLPVDEQDRLIELGWPPYGLFLLNAGTAKNGGVETLEKVYISAGGVSIEAALITGLV